MSVYLNPSDEAVAEAYDSTVMTRPARMRERSEEADSALSDQSFSTGSGL